MDSKVKQLVSDTFIFAIGNALTKLIMFILMPLYTSTLTTAEYGISDTLSTIIELIIPFATLCISDAVFRFSIDEDNKNNEIFSIGIGTVVKGTVAIIIIGSLSYLIFRYEYTLFLILMYIVYAAKQLFGNFLRGLGKVKLFVVNGVIGTLTLVMFNLLFLLKLNMGVKGYLLAIIVSNAIASIFMFSRGKLYRFIKLKYSNKRLKKEMLSYSIPMIPNMVSWWINNTANRYILLFFEGASITGLFSAASKLPAMINLLSSVFQQAWQYSSANEYNKQDKNNFYTIVFKYYSSFILVACSAVVLITPLISKFVLQGKFYIAWRYVPLLLVSATLGCYSIYFGGFYTASKNNKMLMMSTIIGSIVNITFCLVLTPIFGVYGVLIASNFCYLVIVIVRIIDTRKYVQLHTNWFIHILSIIIVTIQSVYETFATANLYMISGFLFVLVLLINIKNMFNLKLRRY
jgi:O-antigen/teichoic acid export membrane protein